MGVVSWVCAELVPKRLVLSSEDTIHRCLAVVLAAAAAALLVTREPTTGHPDAGPPSAESAAAELSRPELEAAIAELSFWLERRTGEPRTAQEANLRLLSLGRAALEPSAASSRLVLANLQVLTTPAGAAQPASVSETAPGSAAPARASAIGDADPRATLAILLEAGTPLTQELALAAGPSSVGRLLELALTSPETPADGPDPWTLDLLSFATLGGQLERREQLGRMAQLGLTWLDRRQRDELAPGNGKAAARALRDAIAAGTERLETTGQRPRELQLLASLFRAVAVLAEPDLEESAVRQLNVLLQRQALEHDAYRALLESAPDAPARARLHIDAIENLGRLAQALYGAHVAFRSTERPAPRTAASLRQAAGELTVHLSALRRASVFDTADGATPPPELLRAVVHALRGLRVSRIAHPAAT
jgi:hypothetical protein